MYETHRPLSLNSHEFVLDVDLGAGDPGLRLTEFETELARKEIAFPQMLGWSGASSNRVLLTGPKEILDAIRDEFSGDGAIRVMAPSLCSVTLTCTGSVGPEMSKKIFSLLKEKGLQPKELRTSSLSVSVFLDHKDRKAAIETLHSLITP